RSLALLLVELPHLALRQPPADHAAAPRHPVEHHRAAPRPAALECAWERRLARLPLDSSPAPWRLRPDLPRVPVDHLRPERPQSWLLRHLLTWTPRSFRQPPTSKPRQLAPPPISSPQRRLSARPLTWMPRFYR